MKSFAKYFGVVAGMAALIVSCNKPENITMPETDTVEMTIIAGSDETKTVLGADGAVTWSTTGTGEKLAVIEQSYVGETPSVAKATSKDGVTSDEGATMSFGVSLDAKTANSFNYYALYPNSAYVSGSNTNVEQFKVALTSTQTPTATSFGPEADILVSKAVIGKTEQPKELRLQFARVIAVGKMTIKNLNTTEKVKKVTFTAAGKPVAGRSYINLTDATAIEYGYADQGVDNVVLDYTGKEISANGMTAYFTCWPFKIAAGESFSVVVETENYTFTRENVTIPADKPLAFNAGRATGFNVSFTGIKGVEKTPATQLVPDGVYVVAQGEKIMTVGTNTSYFGYAAKPAENEDKSITVSPDAAWKFAYDSDSDSYLISSMDDESKYVQGAPNGNTLKLVAQTSATKFKISQNEDGTYKIGSISSSDARYIGYNTSSPRFAMYVGSTAQPVDLNLYTAKVKYIPSITVVSTLEVSSDETLNSFTVSFAHTSDADVTVYQDADCTIKDPDWITANLSADKTSVEYYVSENTGDARTAYIQVYALGEDEESEATAVVTVTQAKAALTAYPYSESFDESKGDFTIDNVTMPSPLTYVWQHTTYSGGNYMKASAFVNGTKYAAESWLISPVIDMSSAVNPVLSFMTVARYGSNENLTLWAREKGGDWAQLSFSNYGSGSDWTFVSNTVDVSAYVGKTLQFAYKYVSTSDDASTWEIKNVEVKEQGAAATLTSISWTGYTTTYTVGDEFKADGTVTATYSDGSTKDVTSEASFSTPNMSTAGTKTVTVTYKGETTTGDITVNEASTGGKTVLFTEGFGDNSRSARVWDDSYKEQGGIESVYSGSTYTITNAKQSKNSMGNTSSALVQTTTGTDAVFEVKSLNVSDYSDLTVSYFWKAGSTKKTYSTSLYYSIDNGVTYTKVEKDSGTGATSFVEVKYTLPAAAVSSNLCLKVIFNTSNTSAYIDDFVLKGNK